MSETLLIDVNTGEVLDDNQAGVLVETLVECRLRVKELMEELEAAEQDERRAEAKLRAAGFGADDRLPYRGQFVVGVEEQELGRETVSKEGCEKHVEGLLSVGLGEMVTGYKTPTAKQVKDKRAELAAAGVPFRDIVPERTVTKKLSIQIVSQGGNL